jgi:hypothetical protein
MLSDGSVLAVLRVTAAGSKRWTLFRIWAHRSEEVATESAPRQVEVEGVHLGRIFVATPRAFVMDASKHLDEYVATASGGLAREHGVRPQFMLFDGGKVHVLPATPQREMTALRSFWWTTEPAPESAVFLEPESGRALLTVVVEVYAHQYHWYPTLYFWDGEKQTPVAWEEAVGISLATGVERLIKHVRGAKESTITYSARISTRSIPGPVGGVSVRLPELGDKPRTWYVPANSTDGKLQTSPRFAVAEHAISLADVILWNEHEVMALSEEGLFRLRRVQ